MKSKFNVFRIIVLVLIIGFSLSACEEDAGGGGAITGKWSSLGYDGTYYSITYVFDFKPNMTFSFTELMLLKESGTTNTSSREGTYSIYGSFVTLDWGYGDDDAFNFNGSSFYFEGQTFTRQ